MLPTSVAAGQAPVYMVQPQQNVVITNEAPHPAAKHQSTFRGLGIAQIVLGVLCFILGIALYVFLSIFYLGTGIWGGILYCISGGLSVSIAVSPRPCNVIAGLVMAIIVSIIGFTCGILDAIGATAWTGITATSTSNFSHIVGIYGALSLFGFIQMILAIVVSAFCCMGTCGQSNVQGQVVGTTTYTTTIPAVQQGYGQPQYYAQPPGAQVYTNVAAQPPPGQPQYYAQPPGAQVYTNVAAQPPPVYTNDAAHQQKV